MLYYAEYYYTTESVTAILT